MCSEELADLKEAVQLLTEGHLGDDRRRHFQPIAGAVGISCRHTEEVFFVLGEALDFEVHVLTTAMQQTARHKQTSVHASDSLALNKCFTYLLAY